MRGWDSNTNLLVSPNPKSKNLYITVKLDSYLVRVSLMVNLLVTYLAVRAYISSTLLSGTLHAFEV